MFTTKGEIQEALLRVGRRLALADASEYSLLVCGGSALCLSGLLERPTRDVDVLGLIKNPGTPTIAAELLPEEIVQAVEMVAQDLNLQENWLNDAAIEVHRLGLPKGILSRASRFEFGPCLTVFLISRQDQIALKLYAAIDPHKGRRHLEDLIAIKPVKKEMEFAVRWLLDRKTSPQFRVAVSSVANALGFSKLKALAHPPQTGKQKA